MSLLAGVSAFPAVIAAAAEEFKPVTYSDVEPVITALKQQITVSNIVTFLAACVGVVVTLAFMWWGVRKVTRMFTSAWKKGKIRI